MKAFVKIMVFTTILAALTLLSIFKIKPNISYLIRYDDTIYISDDKVKFSYENKIIEYQKQDNSVTIDTPDGRGVYNYESKLFVIDYKNNLFDAKYDYITDEITFTDLQKEEIEGLFKYKCLLPENIEEINNDKINYKAKITINIILSVFISILLTLLICSDILFKICKKTKILLITATSMTFVLCILSGIYIFFLFK